MARCLLYCLCERELDNMKRNIILIIMWLLITWPLWVRSDDEGQPPLPAPTESIADGQEYPLLIPPDTRNTSREALNFFQIRSNWEHDFSIEQREILERVDRFIVDLEATGIAISSESTPTDIAGFQFGQLLMLYRESSADELARSLQTSARSEGMTSLILENTDIRDLPQEFRTSVVENGDIGLGILAEDYHRISRELWDTQPDQASYERILFELFGEQRESMAGLIKPSISFRVMQFLIHNVCSATLRRIPILKKVFGGYFPMRNNYVLIPSTASRLDLLHMHYHMQQMLSSRWKFRNHAKAEGQKGKILVEMAAHLYLLKNYKAFGLSFPEVIKLVHELQGTLLHFEHWVSPLKLVRQTYGEPKGREQALELANKLNHEFSDNPRWSLATRVGFAKHDYWSYVGRLHTIFQAYGKEATLRFLMGDARGLSVGNHLGQIFAKEQEFELRTWFGLKNVVEGTGNVASRIREGARRALRRGNIDRARGADPALEEEREREGSGESSWGKGKERKLPDVPRGTHGPGRARGK